MSDQLTPRLRNASICACSTVRTASRLASAGLSAASNCASLRVVQSPEPFGVASRILLQTATQDSQMWAFGPAISFATSLSEREQKEQRRGRLNLMRRSRTADLRRQGILDTG